MSLASWLSFFCFSANISFFSCSSSISNSEIKLLNILNTQYASLEAQLNAAMAILLGDTPNLGDVRE